MKCTLASIQLLRRYIFHEQHDSICMYITTIFHELLLKLVLPDGLYNWINNSEQR